ncbi:MAG: RES family NAD+ phosphorylase [Sarcina sp.]
MKRHFIVEKKSKSYRKAKRIWEEFKKDIKEENRFFSGKDLVKVLDTEKALNISTFHTTGDKFILHRARIGNYVNLDDSEMKRPPVGMYSMGRCNPMGIPYLYLADREETAMKETRARIGDLVTIAKVEVGGIYSFFDLSSQEIKSSSIGESFIEDKIVANLIYIINKDFTKRIDEHERLEYLPLQFVSEYIKNRGFDGFMYQSSLDPCGTNYVIFNPNRYSIVEKSLYIIHEDNTEKIISI